MKFARGETCYILESNYKIRAAKVINKQGDFYVIQLVGSCGAIRLKESRLFKTEDEALSSQKVEKKVLVEEDNPFGYVDVFAGRRTNRNPHSRL